jgi:hypothetical protein
MDLAAICKGIQESDIGTSIRESTWTFPIIETTHVIGLAISVGLILITDLRLTGAILRKRPFSELWAQLKPLFTVGFIVMFLSGILLFWSQASKAYESIFFRTKIVLLILAAANALVFEYTSRPTVGEWDTAALPPPQARLAGWISIILWAGIIAAGRTMAYTF